MSEWTIEVTVELQNEALSWDADRQLELTAVIEEFQETGLSVFELGDVDGVPSLDNLIQPISLRLVAPIPGRYRLMDVEVGPGRYLVIHTFE